MKTKITKNRLAAGLLLFVLLSQAVIPVLVRHSMAATMTYTFVRFDRMATSQPTTGTVCAKPASTATEAGVTVAFPTGYTVSSTVSNWAVGTSNLNWPKDPADGTTTATAWPSISAPTGSGDYVVSGQNVTFVSGDLTAGTWYCFNWTNSAALSTKSSATADNAGTVTTRTSVPANIDSGSYATSTISSDQVTVTASINQTFSFTTSGGGTDALSTLSTGSVASNATTTFTVNTNAKNGWQAWAKDASTGLLSTAATYTIASTGVGSASQALVAGTEGYNLGVAYSQSGGSCSSPTVNANFDKAGGSNKGGGLDTSLRSIFTCNGSTATGVITPTNFAAISGATPAASDYSDTETFVAAGLF
jgi:hypothetical protein